MTKAAEDRSERVLGGFAVRGDFPLPELAALPTSDHLLGSFEVSFGAVPSAAAGMTRLGGGVTIGPRTLRLDIVLGGKGLGRLWVHDGERILVEPETGVAAADLRPFVYGTGLAAIGLQRGVLVLHAATLARNGRAIAIAGPAGTGKSTLAGALCRLGFELMSDDVAVIEMPDRAAIAVFGGVRRLRLWPDSLALLGIEQGGTDREISYANKVIVVAAGETRQPAPLAAIYLLEPGAAPSICRLTSPASAAIALAGQIHRRQFIVPMGRTATMIRLAADAALRVPVHRLRLPRDAGSLAQSAAMVAAHARMI
jgi:hypothetical protein